MEICKHKVGLHSGNYNMKKVFYLRTVISFVVQATFFLIILHSCLHRMHLGCQLSVWWNRHFHLTKTAAYTISCNSFHLPCVCKLKCSLKCLFKVHFFPHLGIKSVSLCAALWALVDPSECIAILQVNGSSVHWQLLPPLCCFHFIANGNKVLKDSSVWVVESLILNLY